jgi:hypothetical protein
MRINEQQLQEIRDQIREFSRRVFSQLDSESVTSVITALQDSPIVLLNQIYEVPELLGLAEGFFRNLQTAQERSHPFPQITPEKAFQGFLALCYDKICFAIEKSPIENFFSPGNLTVSTRFGEKSDGKHFSLPIYFEKDKLPISGNLDAVQISELINRYGFYGKIKGDLSKIEYVLSRIKKIQNDLAHGNVAFRDASRHTVMREMIEYKDVTITYLEDILRNIDDYIDKKQYRRVT